MKNTLRLVYNPSEMGGDPPGRPCMQSRYEVSLASGFSVFPEQKSTKAPCQFFQRNDGKDHLPTVPRSVTPDFKYSGVVWKNLDFSLNRSVVKSYEIMA